MKKTVIGTSGFGLYLMVVMDLALIAGTVFCVVQMVAKAGLAAFFVLAFGLWLIAYVTGYIFANKIIVSEGSVSFREVSMLPGKIKKTDIQLFEIERVYLGNEDFVRVNLPDGEDIEADMDEFYKKYSRSQYSSRTAANLMLIFAVLTKDNHVTVVSTKLFSKSSFRKLFFELKNRNVKMAIQRNI
jgi:hypothetical protein